MSLPLRVTVYDPGIGGAPTTANPRNLSGWATSYEDSLCNEFGCESLRVSGSVASIEEAIDWTQRLMAAVEVDTPSGRVRFRGFLHSVAIPALAASVSLADMANAVIVRYTTPENVKGSQTATNAASIARYGRKELLLNYSSVLVAEATNRAATVLAQLAEPPNKETISLDESRGAFRVDLTFVGWAEALKWLTTSTTTQATAVTSVQVASLIAAYNTTNAFFDTTGAQVVSTGFSATQYCDPDTTYLERIATLMAMGNSSQQRVAWGFYSRAITIGTSAAATPDTVVYSYSRRTRELRDALGNVIPAWDWTPDVMIQNVDAVLPPAPSGALATLTRKYIRRVTLSINERGEVSGSLEPDDPDKLPDLLARPVSSTTGVSSRHAAIEGRIVRAARIKTLSTDGPSFNEGTGVIRPSAGGTGTNNPGTITVGPGGIGPGGIDLGAGGQVIPGGGIITNPGGGNVDLSTGAGIGSAPGGTTVAGSSGTAGLVTKWGPAGTTIVDAVSGTDYAAASHNHAASNITSGTMAPARLGSGTPSSTTFLRGDSAWSAISTITPADISAAPNDAKYIVQTASSGLSAEQALGSLATGMLKNTTTTGVLSIATAADLPDHASRHANGGADQVSLDGSQITTGTVAAARLGSTPSSTKLLFGDNTWAILAAADLPAHVHSGADITSGTVAAARLGATPSSTKLLFGDNTWAVLTSADIPAHVHSGADITSGTVAAARLGATPTAAKVLFGDNTWAVLSSADIPAHVHSAADITSGTLPLTRGGTGATSAALALASIGAAAASHTHAASDVTSGTMATARLGSGTASSTTFLHGNSTWAALVAADLPSHSHAASDTTSGVFSTARLGSGTANSTKYLSGDGTWTTISGVTGTGGTPYLAAWADADTIVSATGITASGGVLSCSDINTGGPNWDLGSFSAAANPPTVGYVGVTIGGVVRLLACV